MQRSCPEKSYPKINWFNQSCPSPEKLPQKQAMHSERRGQVAPKPPLQARNGLEGGLWGYLPALGELLGELWECFGRAFGRAFGRFWESFGRALGELCEIIFWVGSTTQQCTHVRAALTLTWQAAALAKRRWGPSAQSSVFLVSSRQTPAAS